MEMSYDGEFGQIYLHLNDEDIATLQKEKKLKDQEGRDLLLKDIYSTPEARWDNDRLLGIGISNALLETFLDIQKNPGQRVCVERIGGMLSLELLKSID